MEPTILSKTQTALVSISDNTVRKEYYCYPDFVREMFFLKLAIPNTPEIKYTVPGSIHMRQYQSDLSRVDITDYDNYKKIIIRLLQTLAYCLKNQIINLDVKSSNILIDDTADTVVMSDFDTGAIICVDDDNYSYVYHLYYTDGYRPPECHTEFRYHILSDIWALGVVIAEKLAGIKPPIIGDSGEYGRYAAYTGEENSQMSIYLDDDLSSDIDSYRTINDELLRDFLSHMLCLDPDQRWTPDRLLGHPFLAFNDTITDPILDIESFRSRWINSDNGKPHYDITKQYLKRRNQMQLADDFYEELTRTFISDSAPKNKDAVYLYLSSL